MLLQNINTVWGWVLFSGSIAPVYATVYKTVLFTKAVLFHREWARETPLQRRYSADAPGVAIIIASHQEPFEVAKMTFDCAYLTRTTVHVKSLSSIIHPIQTALTSPGGGSTSSRTQKKTTTFASYSATTVGRAS